MSELDEFTSQLNAARDGGSGNQPMPSASAANPEISAR